MSEQVPNEEGNEGHIVTEALPGGWVYFLSAGEAIKIGFSNTPSARISSLQIGHHTQLKTLAIAPTFLITESEAHARFKHLRIRGEWFRPESDLLEFIENLKYEIKNERPQMRKMRRGTAPPKLSKEPTLQELKALRRYYGAESPIGHRCSNLVQIIRNLATYVRPEWATHESQTLPFSFKQQMDGLVKLLEGTALASLVDRR